MTATYGAELLARARDHGMTGEELATMLGLSVPKIRTLAGPEQLERHPVAALRTVAERLGLPWPGWLTAQQPWPDPLPPDARHDPARVHAVLAAAFGQPLHLGEIAQVLGWTTSRVQAAADQLATRAQPGGGTRLTVAGDTLTLDVAPRMLDAPARQRLARMLHAHGLGPDPHVLYLIYLLGNARGWASGLINNAPDLLDEAIDYQLVTYEPDDETGGRDNVRLHPDVEYSLGLTRDHPDDRPAEPQDQTTEDP
jgi:transcriptional regulator with XRE-family HTH domain